MPAGRPPKPTAQHRLDGTYQKCRHENRVDERLAIGAPIKPDFDCEDASKAWDLILSIVEPAIVAKADTLFLAMLSRNYAMYARWLSVAEEERDVDRHYKVAGIVAMYRKPCELGLSKLGMSPVDRAKLIIPTSSDNQTVKTRQRQ